MRSVNCLLLLIGSLCLLPCTRGSTADTPAPTTNLPNNGAPVMYPNGTLVYPNGTVVPPPSQQQQGHISNNAYSYPTPYGTTSMNPHGISTSNPYGVNMGTTYGVNTSYGSYGAKQGFGTMNANQLNNIATTESTGSTIGFDTKAFNEMSDAEAKANAAANPVTISIPDDMEEDKDTEEPETKEEENPELPSTDFEIMAPTVNDSQVMGMESSLPNIEIVKQEKPKKDKGEVKILYGISAKQQKAIDQDLPTAHLNLKPNWKFQKLPPNIAQRVYYDSNTHLPNVYFQYEYDAEAYKYTVHSEDLTILRSLLEKISDINMKNENGNTLLHYATYNHNYDAILLLLHKGANPNVANNFGLRPLHYATYLQDILSVSLLIENDATINVLDSNSMTPLMYAVSKGNVPIMKKLLNNGANVEIKDNLNRTVFDIADQAGEKNILSYLEDLTDTTGSNNETTYHFEK